MFTEVAELLQLLQWRERAKKQLSENVYSVRYALSRLLCHWCCLTVLIAPVHDVFLLLTQCLLSLFFFHLPVILSDVKHSFIANTNKLFLPLLLRGSSCDSCSIKWLWRQQQQHKQLTCDINSIQAATQKVKGKEAHQPLQNPETCFFFFLYKNDSKVIFFSSSKRRKLKNKSVFYITGGKPAI